MKWRDNEMNEDESVSDSQSIWQHSLIKMKVFVNPRAFDKEMNEETMKWMKTLVGLIPRAFNNIDQ